jgi:hypothetical protein
MIKAFKILIALLMFIISVGSWRYQGDIHHMHTKIFKNEKKYTQREYQKIWDRYAENSPYKTMKMRSIHLYEIPQKLWGAEEEVHPSERMMDELIKSEKWSKFVPNSNSTTYPLSQKIWMSQHLTIEELMGFL